MTRLARILIDQVAGIHNRIDIAGDDCVIHAHDHFIEFSLRFFLAKPPQIFSFQHRCYVGFPVFSLKFFVAIEEMLLLYGVKNFIMVDGNVSDARRQRFLLLLIGRVAKSFHAALGFQVKAIDRGPFDVV